jgi:hypothetical protein
MNHQPMHPPEQPPPCTGQQERWLEHPDVEAVWLCRLHCPIRVKCARDAYGTPVIYGLWAGVIIPPEKEQRARRFAFQRIAHIAGIETTSPSHHRSYIARNSRGPSGPERHALSR